MRTTRYRIGGGGAGGGIPTECTPTAVWTDTFGMDDFLKIIYSVPFSDSFGMTEDALGVKVGLFDTVGMDDRLTLAQLVSRFQDTFGVDDRLSLAQIVSRYVDSFGIDDALFVVLSTVFADTIGITDLLTLVTLISRYVESVGISDGALGTTVKIFETFGVDDLLSFVDLASTFADTVGVDDRLSFVDATASFAETFGMDDRLAFVDVFTNQPDTFAVADHFLGSKVGLFDTVGITDNLIPIVKPIHLDTFGNDDSLSRVTIANWTCGRSGTPDTDPCGDGWTDQASTGTNHGNETPLIAKGKSTLANDERRAYVKFNMTRYTNLTAFTGGSHTVRFRATNTSALLAVDLTISAKRHTASPFTESTLAWAGAPISIGVLVKDTVTNIAANTTVGITVTFTDAQLNSILTDGWLFFECRTPGAAAPISVNIVSREGATVSERPTLGVDLKR